MLPFDKKKQATVVVGGSGDLTAAAKATAAQRLIQAIASQDAAEVADAIEVLVQLCED